MTPFLSPFVHIGITTSLPELLVVKANLAAGLDPWKTAAVSVKNVIANAEYVPHPTTDGIVSSGIGGTADHFAGSLTYDSAAAYANAVQYIVRGDTAYAVSAANILDQWAAAFQLAGPTVQNFQGVNWRLNVAWSATPFAAAVELLRAAYPAWTAAETDAIKAMFNKAYLPLLHNAMEFGNREFAILSALMAIGVFNDDHAAFNEGLSHLISYVPSYFFLGSEDGLTPRPQDYFLTTPSNSDLLAWEPSAAIWVNPILPVTNYGDSSTSLNNAIKAGTPAALWGSPALYCNGYSSETSARDLQHADAAFQACVVAMEIAAHQGINLYPQFGARLNATLESSASLWMGVPSNPLCGLIKTGNGFNSGNFEAGYHKLIGFGSMPHAATLISAITHTITAKYISPPYPAGYPALLATNGVEPRVWGQDIWTLTNGAPV